MISRRNILELETRRNIYNFGKPGIGFYTIKSELYKNGSVIDSDSIGKILSLSP
jgi:hypothetical protein